MSVFGYRILLSCPFFAINFYQRMFLSNILVVFLYYIFFFWFRLALLTFSSWETVKNLGFLVDEQFSKSFSQKYVVNLNSWVDINSWHGEQFFELRLATRLRAMRTKLLSAVPNTSYCIAAIMEICRPCFCLCYVAETGFEIGCLGFEYAAGDSITCGIRSIAR